MFDFILVPRVLLFVTLVALTAFMAGVLADHFLIKRRRGHLHSVIRERAVLSQADQHSGGGIAIFGDSIVELALLDDFCDGLPIFNAGVGGYALEDVVKLVGPVLTRTEFDVIIIAVGVNDAEWNRSRNISEWARLYENLLEGLRDNKVYIKSVDQIEREKALGEKYFDPSFIDLQNEVLLSLAKRRGVGLIPPRVSSANRTIDGVHLNNVGYNEFKNQLKAALVCR